MTPLRSAELRDLVIVENEGRVPNGQGGWVTAWVPEATPTRAKIIGLSGSEAIRAGVERAVSQYRVIMRRRAGVTPQQRLKWNGQVMAIVSVVPHPEAPRHALLLIGEIGNGS